MMQYSRLFIFHSAILCQHWTWVFTRNDPLQYSIAEKRETITSWMSCKFFKSVYFTFSKKNKEMAKWSFIFIAIPKCIEKTRWCIVVTENKSFLVSRCRSSTILKKINGIQGFYTYFCTLKPTNNQSYFLSILYEWKIWIKFTGLPWNSETAQGAVDALLSEGESNLFFVLIFST